MRDIHVIVLLCSCLLLAPIAVAQDSTAAAGKNVCEAEAPWNRDDDLDSRADDIKEATDWAKPELTSASPAGGLSGFWSFELHGMPAGEDMATAGRMRFYQQGEGYRCDVSGCGYKPAKADAKWLKIGVRWGHYNYSLRTADNPEALPEEYVVVGDDGSITIPRPQFYPFPEISLQFDNQHPDEMSGTWTAVMDGKMQTGEASFVRSTPTISKVRYISTINDEVRADQYGCVAMDYSGSFWPGNDMRGNRPGFDIELYSDELKEHGYYRLWIDPATKLEIDSSSPQTIYATDENGESTGKIIGLKAHINIWPGSKWGPKALWFEGKPIYFDYYVRPVYPFALSPTEFQLVEGHYPEKPRVRRDTHVGFRLVNLPDHVARNTVIDFRFADAKSNEPAGQVESPDGVCEESSTGTARCRFEETPFLGLDEVEFTVPMPQGGLRWIAEWTTEGNNEMRSRSGVIPVNDAPTILKTFAVRNQDAEFRPQSGMFSYPYPDGGRVAQKRDVAVFGQHLMPEPNGPLPRLESLDKSISYQPLIGNVYSDRYAEAWKALSSKLKVSEETLKADDEILVLQASINGPVLPGEKHLKINGVETAWDLRFGGLGATIQFVRENDPYGDDEDDEDDDILSNAYAPERIYVRVKTSSSLPLDSLPMTLYTKQTNRDMPTVALGITDHNIGKISFTATKTSQGYYYSPPIRLIVRGDPRIGPPPKSDDIQVSVNPDGSGVDLLAAEVEPTFAKDKFAMPVLPAGARMPIARSPEYQRSSLDLIQETSYLFKTALKQASECYSDVQFDDWDDLSDNAAKQFRTRIVFTFGDHLRQTTATFGDHAAMLLLRKQFIELLDEQSAYYNTVLQSELGLQSFLKARRLQFGNDRAPINRVMVTAPDGSKVEFGESALSENIDYLASEFNTTPEKIAIWRLQATAEAINTANASVINARDAAQAIGTCDVEGLLKLTGFGFQAIASHLKPRLMHLTESRESNGTPHLWWEPDEVARGWVDSVAEIAARYREQNKANDRDNLMASAAFAIATAPVSMFGSELAVISVAATDIAMSGLDTVATWKKYYASQAEIDFSRDAAVVIGVERNDAARKEAYTWLDAYVKTLVNVFQVSNDVISASEAIATGLARRQAAIVRGRAVVRNLPEEGGVRALSGVEQRELQIYYLRVKAKEIAHGVDALDDIERRAVTAVETDFRTLQTELIQGVDPNETYLFGEAITLPPPFSAKTARVAFRPVVLEDASAVARAAAPMDNPVSVRMLRYAEEHPATQVLRGGHFEDEIGTVMDRSRRAAAGSGTEVMSAEAAAVQSEPRIVVGEIRSAEDAGSYLSVAKNPSAATAPQSSPGQLVLNAGRDRADIMADRAKALQRNVLELTSEVTGGAPFFIHLGAFRGAGSFNAAIVSETPFQSYRTLIKLGFGGHDAAEEAGRALLVANPSRYYTVARESAPLTIPETVTGPLRNFRSIRYVEDFGDTAAQLMREGKFGNAQRNVLKHAMDDLNDRGIVMFDFKPNNIAFTQRHGIINVAFFDYGGFARVTGGDPRLAREIQNIVSGPWENVAARWRARGVRMGTPADPDIRTEWRKILLREAYRDALDNPQSLGVTSLRDLDFLPAGGETLDARTVSMFTPENR